MPNTAPEARDVFADYLHVAVALVTRDDKILIARRPDHLHQGGLWEFPGGKVEVGESVQEALAREVREELGIAVERARPLMELPYSYPDRDVFLHVWRVDKFLDEPHGREGQPIAWVKPEQLSGHRFPAANGPIIRAARLPEQYLITPEPGGRVHWPTFLDHLQSLMENGLRLVQFRAKALSASDYRDLASSILVRAKATGTRILLNSDPESVVSVGAEGLHLSSQLLHEIDARPLPANYLVGASCHTADDLARATAIDCDFAVLSPVKPTASHPESTPLGWAGFRTLIQPAALPVYALGGQTMADLNRVWNAGGQGIAAIRGLWERL